MPEQESILIFGGTFNPVHFGHINVALEVAQSLGVNTVEMIPNGDPPHRDRPMVAAKERLFMLNTTLEDLPDSPLTFKSNPIEVEREGKSYTFTTLKEIQEANPQSRIFLLLGQDAFDYFYSWYRPDDIAQLCTIIVINRSGYDSGEISSANKNHLNAETLKNVRFVTITPQDISSTRIRQAFKEGEEQLVRSWLNQRVFHFIKEQEFYVE